MTSKIYDTFAICDDKGRYWVVDYTVSSGSDPIFYNGNWLPGDDPEVRILGGTVELMSLKKTRKKTLPVSPETIEKTFSDSQINRKIFY